MDHKARDLKLLHQEWSDRLFIYAIILMHGYENMYAR